MDCTIASLTRKYAEYLTSSLNLFSISISNLGTNVIFFVTCSPKNVTARLLSLLAKLVVCLPTLQRLVLTTEPLFLTTSKFAAVPKSRVEGIMLFEKLSAYPITKRRYAKNDKN